LISFALLQLWLIACIHTHEQSVQHPHLLACRISPATKCSRLWLISMIASGLRSAASDTEARASKKSPARMATWGAERGEEALRSEGRQGDADASRKQRIY